MVRSARRKRGGEAGREIAALLTAEHRLFNIALA
jgi:hypothetical protein